MDVTTISGASAFQQQTIASNVQSSVAAKTLDIARTEGAGALQLLQSATLHTAPEPTTAGTPSGGVDTYG
jgi:hypothetical protein